MKLPSKFLPYILIVFAIFIGRWTAPDRSKELERKHELERKYHLDKIENLEEALADRDKVGQSIIKKMYSDSVKNSEVLKANKEAYLKLKKKYNEINLNRASVHQLDSLRAGIIALHTAQ